MSEIDLTIREVVPEDALQVLKISEKLGRETDFLLMDERGMDLPEAMLAQQLLALYEHPAQLLLAAFVQDEMVALASVKTEPEWRIAHVGEIGISVLKDYWGMGLGSILMEELLVWVEKTPSIKRLELTVQVRNKRGIRLYEKYGFQIEGRLSKAARSKEGELIDLFLMAFIP